ncbi:peptidoglycan editing factor PgeF [Candidatus Babeliales bacterium]|nr:peptidoglycan editing factor PgeF [Candidatus Babeliales bacterium]
MNTVTRHSLHISFQNAATQLSMYEIKELRYSDQLWNYAQSLGCSKLVILDQTHSAYGVCVDQYKSSSWFEQQGDFLISKTKGIALAVLTADCMPLVFFDTKHKAVAVVHAGWRGLAQNIVQSAFEMMQSEYGTLPENIQVTIGPSALGCCYEVSENFIENFKNFNWASKALCKRDNRWYFNTMIFLKNQLQFLGVLVDNVDTQYATCTICDDSYCSYRRQKDQTGRQVTIVTLTE